MDSKDLNWLVKVIKNIMKKGSIHYFVRNYHSKKINISIIAKIFFYFKSKSYLLLFTADYFNFSQVFKLILAYM